MEIEKVNAILLISIFPILIILPMFIYKQISLFQHMLKYISYFAIGALISEIFVHLFEEVVENNATIYCGIGALALILLDISINHSSGKLL